MNLEQLLNRAKEIEDAIVNMTTQLHALHGHKAETAHWISQMKEAEEKSATQVEEQSDPVVQ